MTELFQFLSLETISSCNRSCPTCLRNSHPDRQKVSSWFTHSLMPLDTIHQALHQAHQIGFTGPVILSHYNEPLMDDRLPEIAELTHFYGMSNFCHTNGDLLDERIAERLDGKLDKIIVSLYMAEPMKSERAEWVKSLFDKTTVKVFIQSGHITSHYSPRLELRDRIEKAKDTTCTEPRLHCIINHLGQFLLCCEDLIGNFSFGSFPETSIQDYWYGTQHTGILETLIQESGRRVYTYCSICPK